MPWLILILGAAVIAVLKRERFPEQRLLQKPGVAPTVPIPPGGVRAIEAALQTPKPPPAPLMAAIQGLDFTDPVSLMRTANAAQAHGYPESAKALASKAQDLGDIVSAIEKSGTAPIPSPISDVSAEKWTKFANLFKGKTADEISPAFHLGLFNIGFMRLRDLGLASNLKKVAYKGAEVWQGDMEPPMTIKSFLANPAIQYKVFARDMKDRAMYIQARYGRVIGKPIEGVPATLSGLMAAIKLAGTRGFDKWINDPAERAKFITTTAAYKAANNIF